MNFRGSTGYGYDFMKAGLGKWGLEMQYDVEDATKWIINEGIAAPDRICIVGGSYGGYAALMGVSGGSQRIVQGIIWANYYGRFGLGKVQGSAMMVGITGAAIGPLPLGLFFDFNGNYTWGILLLTALTIIAFLSIVVLRPEKGLEVKMPNSNPS